MRSIWAAIPPASFPAVADPTASPDFGAECFVGAGASLGAGSGGGRPEWKTADSAGPVMKLLRGEADAGEIWQQSWRLARQTRPVGRVKTGRTIAAALNAFLGATTGELEKWITTKLWRGYCDLFVKEENVFCCSWGDVFHLCKSKRLASA